MDKYNIWDEDRLYFVKNTRFTSCSAYIVIRDLEKSEADLICADLNAFVKEQDKALTAKIASIKKLLENKK